MAPKPVTLTLAMIVRDGGQFLAPLLDGARPWVDEIVIGDTGSVDGSPAVAAAAGANVHHLKWQDDFALSRNEVLDRCRGDWIVVLDADEQLCPADWRALRRWLCDREAASHPCAGLIDTRNYLADRQSRRGWTPLPDPDPHILPGGPPADGYVTTSKVRLFPNRPGVRFRGRLHETVEASLRDLHLPVVALPWPVHHFGYLIPSGDKDTRYLHLAHLKTTEEPHSAGAWSELADCAVALGDHARARVAIARSLALEPDHAGRRLTYGWLCWQMGDAGQADRELQQVLAAAEIDDYVLAEAAHLRAQIALREENPEAAAHSLAMAVRLFPDNGHFQNTLGALHLHLGRHVAARRALERSCALLPGLAEPRRNLALLEETVGA